MDNIGAFELVAALAASMFLLGAIIGFMAAVIAELWMTIRTNIDVYDV